MKTERILEIADLIEAGHDRMHFDMQTYGCSVGPDDGYSICGTAACIAGWAVARFGKTGRATKVNHRRMLEDDGEALASAHENAAGVLGLGCVTAKSLFLPNSDEQGVDLHQVTEDHAVRTLRHLAKTGKVDWRATA